MRNHYLSNLKLIFILSCLLLSTFAIAGHPRRADMAEVQRLAHDIAESAEDLHYIAEELAHHGGQRERNALRVLHRLDNKAQHFHEQVERYRQNPEYTEDDFRELLSVYRSAKRVEHDLHGANDVRRHFRQLDSKMRRLKFFYERTSDRFNYRRVMKLAHTIHKKSKHFHRQIEREFDRSGHTTQDEREAISAAHEMAEAAEHLHENVESRNTSSSHTYNDFVKLNRTFNRVKDALQWVHVSSHVLGDYYETKAPMRELKRIYGYNRGGRHDY